MLPQLAPRFTNHARQFFTPGLLRAFPRNPVFFSTTARRFNAGSPGQDDCRTKFPPAVVKDTEPGSESALTNQTVTPVSVSFTLSPPPTFAFLKPTPVVLLTGPFGGNWCYRDTWQTSLADQGYQSTSIELKMPSEPLESGDDYIRHFANALKTSIEIDHSFYPPILIAHGLHALVAQKYVESNPVSALVLVSPFIPELIKERFQELSHTLLQSEETANSAEAAVSLLSDSETSIETGSCEHWTEEDKSTWVGSDTEASPLELYFETHADVVAQVGFRERYILPKKAVYMIDQIAKEHQEMERERDEKEKQHEQTEAASDVEKEPITSDTPTTSGPEVLGKDSVPVWETTSTGGATAQKSSVPQGTYDDTLPEQTVKSEASIPSPLEKLPLSIYDSIQWSIFEPNFPILLVTSNGDELVSTDDVKEYHDLAGLVDHVELEDLDDGGHLIMVADSTEWEQGIQGITAWLDSNGM